MKKTEKKELQSKTVDELIKALKDTKIKLSKAMLDFQTRKAENVNEYRKIRKEIARINTYLTEKKEVGEAANKA